MKTKSILGTIMGLVAVLALGGNPAGAGTPARPEVSDPAGDANFINGQTFLGGLEQGGVTVCTPDDLPDPLPPTFCSTAPGDTRPASIDGADLRAIWLETTYDTVKEKNELGQVTKVRHVPQALRVTFRTEGPIERPASGLFFQLPTRIAGCNVIFRAWLSGPAAPVEESAQINKSSAVSGGTCPGGTGVISSPDFSFKVTGNELELTYPLAALPYASNQLVLQPDVVIGPSPSRASVRPVIGILGMNTQIDETHPYGIKFLIAADIPADVDCLATPTHSACVA